MLLIEHKTETNKELLPAVTTPIRLIGTIRHDQQRNLAVHSQPQEPEQKGSNIDLFV